MFAQAIIRNLEEQDILNFLKIKKYEDKESLDENKQKMLLKSEMIYEVFHGKNFLVKTTSEKAFEDLEELIRMDNFYSEKYQSWLKTQDRIEQERLIRELDPENADEIIKALEVENVG